jgi:hypothetical protein
MHFSQTLLLHSLMYLEQQEETLRLICLAEFALRLGLGLGATPQVRLSSILKIKRLLAIMMMGIGNQHAGNTHRMGAYQVERSSYLINFCSRLFEIIVRPSPPMRHSPLVCPSSNSHIATRSHVQHPLCAPSMKQYVYIYQCRRDSEVRDSAWFTW